TRVLMNLEYGLQYEAFRAEVRAFLDRHKSDKPALSLIEVTPAERARWLSLLIEHGYFARTIPREYGGYGAAPGPLATPIMAAEVNRPGGSRRPQALGPSMLLP